VCKGRGMGIGGIGVGGPGRRGAVHCLILRGSAQPGCGRGQGKPDPRPAALPA